MTIAETEIAHALNNCTYLPGSFEKRFARNIYSQAKYNSDYELTEKQRNQLYRQLYRYRRQVPETYKKYENKCLKFITDVSD